MISDKAKGLSGLSHVAHTKKLMDESTKRYHHSCLSAGLTIKKTGKAQDIGHVDFVVNGETVDLKGLKNSTREGKILLEFLNVNGKTGWCNENGTPLWIAFDFGAFFLHAKNVDFRAFLSLLSAESSKIAHFLVKIFDFGAAMSLLFVQASKMLVL